MKESPTWYLWYSSCSVLVCAGIIKSGESVQESEPPGVRTTCSHVESSTRVYGNLSNKQIRDYRAVVETTPLHVKYTLSQYVNAFAPLFSYVMLRVLVLAW